MSAPEKIRELRALIEHDASLGLRPPLHADIRLLLDHIASLEAENARLVKEHGAAVASYRCAEADAELWQIQADKAAAAESEREALRVALLAASLGLDDLMRTLYAPELYRPEHVEESHVRIGKAGAPLAYVADLQEQAARALSSPKGGK